MPGHDEKRYEWETGSQVRGREGARPVGTRSRKHKKKRLFANMSVVLVLVIALSAALFAGRLLVDGLAGEEDAKTNDSSAQISSSQAEKVTGTETNGEKVMPSTSEETEDPLTPDSEEKLNYIRENSQLFPARLVTLAERNPETIDYVYQYPQLHDQAQTIDLSAEAASGEVPLLMQWDTRWGYEEYGDGLMGYTGCGPTCLSMVAIYLTGNPKITPLAVAEYSEGSGFYYNGTGTAWLLMSEGCEGFGLKSEEVSLHDTYFYRALDAGKVIVCAMGPGDFTDEGHFIVICGYEGESFIVRDPNSVANSTRTWTFDELKDQIRGVWALSKN